MPIIEHQPNCIIANRLNAGDRHMSLPGDDLLLTRPMTLHLGARALDPQILRRQR